MSRIPLLALAAALVALPLRADETPVTWIDAAQVEAAFAKGMPLTETSAYKVHASRRDAPGQAEIHVRDTDVIHVLEGAATFVTGGRAIGAKPIAPDELRGSAIEGGVARALRKGDVVIVPAGVPHWFREVQGPLLYYVVKVTAPAGAGAAAQPDASIDLATREGVAAVQGAWRYGDVRIVAATHRAPDAQGQPTGPPVATNDYEPHAGAADFDDSAWPVVDPTALAARRGNGRLSFGWYRIAITIPERAGALDTKGSAVWFQTTLDDYAEVWVDGQLARGLGQQGGSVIAGWNAPNRVLLTRQARPGQKIQIAVFAANGPLSDPPANFLWVREARLDFERAGLPTPVAIAPREVNVRIERTDPALDAIVPANPKIYQLAEGFEFTEGPVWLRDRGVLLFSDPNANRIYEYDPRGEGSLRVFRDKSGYDGADIAEYGQPGSNGLALDPQGRLTSDEHGRHRVTRARADGALEVLADSFEGKRLNSPNDLVWRSDGTLYFTDPPFGLPKFFADPRKQLAFSGVFAWKDGALKLVSKDFSGPNGLAFSPDEKFLYVDDWDEKHKVVMRYDVQPEGSLANGRVFFDVTAEAPGEIAFDGLKVDRQGNVYVSGPGGVWIVSPQGTHLGTIVAPQLPANFAFGGSDGRTLFLAARTGLYRIEVRIPGAAL